MLVWVVVVEDEERVVEDEVGSGPRGEAWSMRCRSIALVCAAFEAALTDDASGRIVDERKDECSVVVGGETSAPEEDELDSSVPRGRRGFRTNEGAVEDVVDDDEEWNVSVAAERSTGCTSLGDAGAISLRDRPWMPGDDGVRC